jgi:YHS domain-containing protein
VTLFQGDGNTVGWGDCVQVTSCATAALPFKRFDAGEPRLVNPPGARRTFVKRAIILGATLLALVACSTTHRLLEPDQAANNLSPEKPSSPVQKGQDPVCGASMDNTEVLWHASYHGTTYYFDSEECQRQFQENPELFTTTVR